MRIVFIAPRFHTNQLGLVRCLVEHGHVVQFLVLGRGHSEVYPYGEPRVVRITRIGEWVDYCFNPARDFGRFSRLAIPDPRDVCRFLSDFAPDVAVLRLDAIPFVAISVPWFFLHRTRIVLYSQGAKYRRRVPRKRRILVWLIRKVLGWQWMTPVERFPGVPRESPNDCGIEYLPFIQETAEGAALRSYDVRCPRLLTVGKFMPRKNHVSLVRAFAEVLRKRPCRLTIIGEATSDRHRQYVETLRHLLEELELGNTVAVLENLSHDDVLAAYGRHDVFVLASWDEPASLSQLEAMAHGLPVVICRENGTASYVDDGVTGVVCGGDPADLAAGILEVVSDGRRMTEFGREAAARVEEWYSCRANWTKISELFGVSPADCDGYKATTGPDHCSERAHRNAGPEGLQAGAMKP